jgi:uncharacterized membrane protein YphA (DoxX/SURF4 family)
MHEDMSKIDEAVRSGPLDSPSRTRRQRGTGKGMSVALWNTQALLAALFVFAGVMKFVMPLEEMVKQSSLPAWFLLFIGVAEVLGGIGVIVPALLRVWPVLTPVAACGLLIIMAGATLISLPMGAVALFPFLVGVLAGFVAYGRWRLKPIQARP